MVNFRRLLIWPAAFGLAGCAIHPLPVDVLGPRFDTRAIVHHIRCEARSALANAIIYDFRTYYKGQPAEVFANRLADGEILLEDARRYIKLVGPAAAADILKYQNSAIAYDFTFDITEDNAFTSQVDLLNTLSRGSVGLGLKAGADFQRETVRIFRVTDSFNELANMPTRECDDNSPSKDYAYPVRGKIGLDEMVETFVRLNEYEHLSAASSGDSTSKGSSGKTSSVVPVLSDTFNFQTTLTGSAAPTITLTPLSQAFHVADASIGAAGSRKDIHKVIIAISLPPSKGEASRSGPGITLLPNLRTVQPASAKQRANDAIDDQITRSIINQLSLTPH